MSLWEALVPGVGRRSDSEVKFGRAVLVVLADEHCVSVGVVGLERSKAKG